MFNHYNRLRFFANRSSLLLLFAFLWVAYGSVSAQNIGPQPYVPGSWNAFANPAAAPFAPSYKANSTGITNGYWQTRFATPTNVSAGAQTFKTVSSNGSNVWQNQWLTGAVTVGSIQSYPVCFGCSPADDAVTLANNKTYTYNFEDAGYVTAKGVFIETDFTPLDLSGATLTSSSGGSISLTFATGPATGENIYCRYSTSAAMTSSTLVQMPYNSSFQQARVELPIMNSGTTVYFTMYSSPYSLATIQSAVTTHGEAAHDLLSLSRYSSIASTLTFGGPIVVKSTLGSTIDAMTYGDLSSAFSQINSGTHKGVITISVNGNSTEPAMASLNATTGSAATTPFYTAISIQPVGGATRTISSNGLLNSGLVQLNGATNVTIDGLNTGSNALVINNSNTGTAASALRFTGDASNNSINRITLRGAGAATTLAPVTGVVAFAIGNSTGNDNNTFNDCDITNSGSNFSNYGIYALGSGTILNDNNTIQNCRISNFFSASTTNAGATTAGVFLGTGNNTWTITGNRLFQTAQRTYVHTATAIHYGFNIATTVGKGHTITNNVIGYADAAATATGFYDMTNGASTAVAPQFYGMWLLMQGGTPLTTVSGNTIANIKLTTGAGNQVGFFTGMMMGNATASDANFTNNTIGSSSGTGSIIVSLTGTSTGGVAYAIRGNGVATSTMNVTGNTAAGISISAVSNTVGFTLSAIRIFGYINTTTGNTVGNGTANNLDLGSATSTAAVVFNGIQINGTGNATVMGTLVSPNIVQNTRVQGTGTGTTYALNFSGSGTCSIVGNTVRNISANNTAMLGVLTNLNTNLLQIDARLNTSQQGSLVGIYMSAGVSASPVISDNLIHSLSNTNTGTIGTSVQGISLQGSNAASVLRNRIYGLSHAGTSPTTTAVTSGTVISTTLTITGAVSPNRVIGISSGFITGTLLIANNMISLGIGETNNVGFVGICSQFTNAGQPQTGLIHAYHNTVYIGGNATASGTNASFAFLRGDYGNTPVRSGVNLVNNIFYNARTSSAPNAGTHYAIGNGHRAAAGTGGDWDNTSLSFSNYNMFYATNPATLTNWLNSDMDLDTWRTTSRTFPVARATGLDEQSVTGFTLTFADINTADLHINMGSTPVAIESGGITTSSLPFSITTDYDNGARNALLPDMGADEFVGVPNDIVPPVIAFTALGNTANQLDRTFTATIADPSGVNLSSVRVYYRKGAGTWFSSVPSFSAPATYTFTIVAADMGGLAVGNTVEYYVAAADLATVPNSGTLPLGGLGASPPVPARSYTILAGLSGTYYVGAASCAGNTPTYASLTAALAAYNTSGLATDVTFTLTDATINTAAAYIINPNGDADATHKLTITPCASVATTITSTAGDVFDFEGADWITIDGVNTGGTSLTLVNNSAVNGQDVMYVFNAGSEPCTNLTFKNLTMRCASAFAQNTSTNTTYGVYVGGSLNNNLTVDGCTIDRVTYGIRTGAGSSATFPTTGSVFKNNIIGPAAFGANQIGYTGILLQNENGPQITDNEIRFVGGAFANIPAGATYDRAGIILSNTFGGNQTWSGTGGGAGSLVKNALVARNKIHDIMALRNGNSAVGIVVAGADGANNTNNVIANNMIYNVLAAGTSTATDQAVGIAVSHGRGDKIVYNTISMTGDARQNTSTPVNDMSSYGISIISGPSNLTVAGNIIQMDMTSTGATGVLNGCINYPAGYNFGTGTLNNNNYFTNPSNAQARVGSIGGGLAAGGGTFYTTLSAWKVGSGRDAASYDVNPMFTSATDLHINSGITPIGLESNGGSYGISNDIDNQTRPGGGGILNGGGSAADIGADEFDGVPAPPMVYVGTTATHTSSSACKGSGNVQILRIKVDVTGILTPFAFTSADFNLSAVTALTDIIPSGCKLYSTGTTPAFATTNLLASANAASSLTLNGFNATLVNGSNYFWLTFDLAGNAGGNNTLDAALTNIVLSGNTQSIGTPGNPTGSVTIGGPMSGTFAIGASGAAYSSMTEAIADLVCREYGGAVTFELIDPAYSTLTGESFPIVIPIVTGSSATNTLTIRPATGVTTTISGASASSIFTVAGADHITIEGTATGGTNARDLTIQNLSNAANTGVVMVQSSGTNAGATNFTIKNTNIIAGSGATATTTAISIGGNAINTIGDDNDNITIQNNVITSAGTGLFIAANATGTSNNITVTGNTFGSTSPADYLTQTAIRLQQVTASTISGNTIQNVIGATQLANAGISGVLVSGGVASTTIARNTIAGVRYTGTNAFSGAGINVLGTNTGVTISNNTISDVNGTGANTASLPIEGQSVFGIALGGTASSITVHNNTVALSGTTPSAGPRSVSAALYVGTGATSLDIRGNILRNSLVNSGGNSGTAGAFALYSNTAATGFSNLNYNSYFTGGADSRFNQIAGTQYATLAAWKTAVTVDANAQSADPVFVSSTDFHLVKTGSVNCALKGANDPSFSGTTDIDGDTRGALPGIGSDNFDGTAAPATATACSFAGNNSIVLRTSASGVIEWYSSATYPATSADLINTGANTMMSPTTAPTTIAAYVQDATDGCFSAPKLATITQRTVASTTVPSPAASNRTYYATHEVVNGAWTHYCDCDNDLVLLSVNKGTWNPGALVLNDANVTNATQYAVRADVGATPTFNISSVTSSTRYTILATPWIVMNRTWDVKLFNNTQEPSAPLAIRSYYNYADFTAVNAAMASAGGAAIPTEADLTIYKLDAVSAPLGSMYPNSWLALQAGHDGVTDAHITPYHSSMASAYNWAFSLVGNGTVNSGARSTEYTISAFSGGGGGGGAGGAGAFPVEWLDFKVAYDNNVVNLDWTTATEVNVNHFDVERSQDGNSFTSFGSVKAVGNSQSPTSYGYVDIAPSLGRNYYRIKSVDVSGHTQYTDQVQVFVGGSVAIFPNPATDELCVRMSSNSSATRIEIYAPDGKLVQSKTLESSSSLVQKLDVSDLTSGMYLFKVIDGTEVITGKFLKK